jgi:hypothetical protein
MTGSVPSGHTAPLDRGMPTFAERFALFAECLVVGVLVTLSLPGLVTILPAWAAGCAHIRAHLDGESTPLARLLRNCLTAFKRSLRVSLLLAAALALVAFDLLIVWAGLPGGRAVAAVCAVAATGLIVVTMRAGSVWTPGDDWTALLRDAVRRSAHDIRGTLLVVLALGMLAVITWQLLSLLIPMLGCVAMATVAVERRRAPQP